MYDTGIFVKHFILFCAGNIITQFLTGPVTLFGLLMTIKINDVTTAVPDIKLCMASLLV